MLHGIDTIREKAKQPLQDSQTDIVCVLGTVPTFLLDENMVTLNTPVPIRNYHDVAKYAGENLSDFTMYDALETILTESKGATIYMINVFDKNTHRTTVTDETHSVSAAKFEIEHPDITDLVVKNNGTAGVLNTDYKITVKNESVSVELISETFIALSSVTCSYSYADVTKVTATDFVGTIDANGNRSGSKAITNITQLYGDDVNIIIAPKYSALSAVRTALVSVAEDIKARVYLDCPVGTSVNSAISARINGELQCTSENAFMAMPYVYRYNQYTNKNELKPLSPVLAGLRVKLNRNNDVATSIDNTKTTTVKGLEFPVEFILNKENTESNALNAAGIATVINWKGSFRIWGARNCSYPSSTGIETFDSVIDTANFIEKTIEAGSFECVGAKITRAFIDNITETIKAKFNTWKNPEIGLILDGDVWYDEALNPEENLSNGFIVFSYDFCPPSVAEHIRYRSYINVKYLTTALANT